MDQIKKPLDDLVADRRRKEIETEDLGREIASSATPIAVAFVDLADSTRLKQDRKPEEWLGYIFHFLQRVDRRARDAGGTVVKRIGDEVMVTFDDVSSSERFVDSLIGDSDLQAYRYKIGTDFGSAYHFRFSEHLAHDPYGPVVDRCARIAKLAGAGAVLCSSDYQKLAGPAAGYVSVGSFPLRGLPAPTELFARFLIGVDSAKYLEPLVNALNEQSASLDGYRLVGRKLTTEFVREFGEGRVRPFLARELLNVPRLPYSLTGLDDIVRLGAGNHVTKTHEFMGYLLECEGELLGFSRDSREIKLELRADHTLLFERVELLLPLSYGELVKPLPKGVRLRARGVICDYFVSITLNYVDVDVIAPAAD